MGMMIIRHCADGDWQLLAVDTGSMTMAPCLSAIGRLSCSSGTRIVRYSAGKLHRPRLQKV